MARPRIELQRLLEETVGEGVKVYNQAPTKLVFPCVKYERSKIDIDHADNKPYIAQKQYTLTVIYRDPDSDLPDKIAKLPSCSHDRKFVNDNLHHDVFIIYF